MTIGAPQKTRRRNNVQALSDDGFLSIPANHGKDFTKIKVSIGINAGQIARLTGVWVGRMEQHKVDLGVLRNHRLQICRVCQHKAEVCISQTGVQLQWLVNVGRRLGRLEQVEGLQHDPVVQRLVLHAERAGLLPKSAGQSIQHSLGLWLRDIQPGAIADDGLEPHHGGVRDGLVDLLAEGLTQLVQLALFRSTRFRHRGREDLLSHRLDADNPLGLGAGKLIMPVKRFHVLFGQ